MKHLILLLTLFLLSSCAGVPDAKEDIAFKQSSYSKLPAWNKDNHSAAIVPLRRSCQRIMKKSGATGFGPDGVGGTYADWQPVCQRLHNANTTKAKQFFESNFTPWLVSSSTSGKKGLFTGYYEPSLHGSRSRLGPYQYPLHVRPKDLIDVELGEFRDDLKGRRIAGHVKGNKLVPYPDRRAITEGRYVQDFDEPIVWVNDPIEAFFLHIQGSGRIELVDGDTLRVGYAGQNGHPYYAIGRTLVKTGAIPKDQISLQSIRKWLQDNPDQAMDLMFENPSYVFFRELEEAGPIGAEGLPLTPLRSLAVDRKFLPYGAPVYLSTEPPMDHEPSIKRLMIAQDTGGAIKGAVRGDVFWGHGKRAERLAGHMKAKGSYWVLLPNGVNPNTARRR